MYSNTNDRIIQYHDLFSIVYIMSIYFFNNEINDVIIFGSTI